MLTRHLVLELSCSRQASSVCGMPELGLMEGEGSLRMGEAA